MASNHTSSYQLNQWEPEDKVLRTEFNEDNAKIDSALAGLAQSLTVKADQSALTALSSKVTGQATTLSKKGNCEMSLTTYQGKNAFGSENPTKITLPWNADLAFVTSDDGGELMFLRVGVTSGHVISGGSSGTVSITWSGRTASVVSRTDARRQMNDYGTYYIFAFRILK